MKVSDVLRRSSLGIGWYVIKEDGNWDGYEVVGALMEAGACAVRHSGMFQPTIQAIGFPGGFFYEVVGSYGFFGLGQGMWLCGPTAVRQVFRLLNLDQPTRRLSGETDIPSTADLILSWEEFATREELEKVGLSLGALAWMKYDRRAAPGQFEPISLPIPWSSENPPPGKRSDLMHPRQCDSFFWTAEETVVEDRSGTYELRPDGRMTPIAVARVPDSQ